MDPTDTSPRALAFAPPGGPSAARRGAAPMPPRGSRRGTPTRTPPLPEDRFVGWEAGPDPTTAIGEYNVEGEWALGREVAEISLGGSSRCAISIPGRGLSARHCLLERRAYRLRLHDLDSSHGTFVRARKLDGSVELHPGDLFTARPMTFVCLNDDMRQHRPTLFEILGAGAARGPDWVLVQAALGAGPLLFTGDAGCDLDRLARAVHAVSPRRIQPPVEGGPVPRERAAQVALIRRAAKTSLILSLDSDASIDPEVAAMLFDARGGVRLLALAASPDVARRVVSAARVERMHHVPVRPLRSRGGDLATLLDRTFAERAGSLRVVELTPANQAALTAYAWPGNFDELRAVTDAIKEYITRGGLRPAAQSLGMPHQTLHRRLARIGLTLPLVPRDA